MSHLQKYRQDPEFNRLEAEIVETRKKLDELLLRLKDSFPLSPHQTWAITAAHSLGVFSKPEPAEHEED